MWPLVVAEVPSWITPENAFAVALLALAALAAGAAEVWVYGRTYRREVGEKDEWRKAATENLKIANDALQTAKEANTKLDRLMAILERHFAS